MDLPGLCEEDLELKEELEVVVGLMNTLKAQVEEVIFQELIYA